MSKKDGGPAFPGGDLGAWGMNLRDYFAAHALELLEAYSLPPPPAQIAKDAYAIADAMLEEREK